ncbi:hypothetical protein [Listeria innocua]|uniref:hypothetical protein n=1 Tax=Listeria innocua TaxID=1642 RepID=UPI001F1663F9|nr:hypothetical protein [Listeria innocua]UVD68500.1 hypothetical protein NVV61_12975 [Listeria innocua]WCT28050.1 hypothetical protein PQQ29_13540 [Listeria innocua]
MKKHQKKDNRANESKASRAQMFTVVILRNEPRTYSRMFSVPFHYKTLKEKNLLMKVKLNEINNWLRPRRT